jgi:hypothetical protein
MKAYRLSVFLTTSSNGRRPAPFSHHKVLKYTLIMVLITAVLLLIAHLADPPMVKKIVIDVYRQRLDYHECRTGKLTLAIQYIIVLGHFICSVYCIARVRNGLEAFKDGTIIKESFIIFYLCIIVLAGVSTLDIDKQVSISVRVALLNIGNYVYMYVYICMYVNIYIHIRI